MNTASTINHNDYDNIIVSFSGGKDSAACVLQLLEQGVPASKIELWHCDIDGREGSNLMDYHVTRDYCKKFAAAFNLPIYFMWKVGGFEGEMLRENAKTQPVCFETPSGEVVQVGGKRGKESTRLMFPQTTADLSVRWCSAYLKIDVCCMAVCNQDRFLGKRTLMVTGERAEESAARANYNTFEADRTDNRNGKRNVRHVDHARPIHGWSEQQVWAIIEKHQVRVHPCYYLGYSRCSCMFCIFGNADQWATCFELDPTRTEAIADWEELFGKTIKRTKSVRQLIAEGKVYDAVATETANRQQVGETEYTMSIIMDAGTWVLPAGAYGESCGPV